MSVAIAGACMCGCGQITPIETRNRRSRGRVKGQHSMFITGHNSRNAPWKDRHTAEASGCWEWHGAKGERDYGRMGRNGRVGNAHRFYYEQYVGLIAPGLVIDHLCRNHSCVNPKHLEPVTQAENLRRGRIARDA